VLQVLHLDVLKVDRVLHMRCTWEAGGSTSGPRAMFGPRGPCVIARNTGTGRGMLSRARAWSASARGNGVQCERANVLMLTLAHCPLQKLFSSK
jgi:hypothetical protein